MELTRATAINTIRLEAMWAGSRSFLNPEADNDGKCGQLERRYELQPRDTPLLKQPSNEGGRVWLTILTTPVRANHRAGHTH